MKFILQWGGIFLLCIAVRLPYLLGTHVYFDGDEAIVGIMAQDLLDGKNIPVYFYGQQYGFSFFEVLATAFFLLFLGNGVFALKLGGLLLFSLGLTFIRKLLADWQIKPWLAWLMILLLAIFPIWFIWATKVRGGYITAFTAVCIITYLLGKKQVGTKEIILSAILVAIAAVSHLMLLLPFGLLLVYFLWKKLKFSQVFIWILICGISFFLLRLPAYVNEAAWTISPRMELNMISLEGLLSAFPNIFMGYFYYDYLFPIPAFMMMLVIANLLMFLVLFFIRVLKGNKQEKIILCLGLVGFVITCLFALYIDGKGYRYLIGPLTVFAALFVFMFYSSVKQARQPVFIFIVYLILFVTPISAYHHIPAFWHAHEINDMKALKELNYHLNERNISGIFCTDPLLAWQLNYYGKDRYAARYLFQKDRVQTFIEKTDNCYADTTCNTAIVGIYGSALGMDSISGWHESVIYAGERFYIQPQVKKEFLTKAGFELPE